MSELNEIYQNFINKWINSELSEEIVNKIEYLILFMPETEIYDKLSVIYHSLIDFCRQNAFKQNYDQEIIFQIFRILRMFRFDHTNQSIVNEIEERQQFLEQIGSLNKSEGLIQKTKMEIIERVKQLEHINSILNN